MTETLTYSRSFPLIDIEILDRSKGGDGRTVTAYAAIYNTPVEINDQYGNYNEKISPTAFKRTLDNNSAMRALALYNHGMNVVDGKPEAMYGVPLGKPLEIKSDARGLMTVTRYNNSALSDSILESIKNGDITAQSFRGRIYKSDPMKVPRVKRGDPLPTVTRTELGLSDYGPTPTPYYQDAAIVAVRSTQELASEIELLEDDKRAELIRLLSATSQRELGTDDSHVVHSTRNLARLRAKAAFLGVL